MSDRRKHLKALKKSKAYRDAYMAEQVRAGIAFQIKALRDQLGMTQAEFAALIGTTQDAISSRYENPEYDTISLKKLIQIGEALGIALVVRFVDYNKFLETYEDVTPDALRVTPIDELSASSSSPAAGLVDLLLADEDASSSYLAIAPTNQGNVRWPQGSLIQNLQGVQTMDLDLLYRLQEIFPSDEPPISNTFMQTTATSGPQRSTSRLPSRRSATAEKEAA